MPLLISAYPGNGVVSVNYNNMPIGDDINLREGYEITIQVNTPGKYNAIAGLYFDDFMCYLHDTEDTSVLKDADYTKDAENYLLKAGMTKEEISNLMKYLTE